MRRVLLATSSKHKVAKTPYTIAVITDNTYGLSTVFDDYDLNGRMIVVYQFDTESKLDQSMLLSDLPFHETAYATLMQCRIHNIKLYNNVMTLENGYKLIFISIDIDDRKYGIALLFQIEQLAPHKTETIDVVIKYIWKLILKYTEQAAIENKFGNNITQLPPDTYQAFKRIFIEANTHDYRLSGVPTPTICFTPADGSNQ